MADMSITRQGVLDALKAHGADLRRLGVRRLGLFGSCARNEQTDASDLDFLVDLEPKTFDTYMNVKLYLEELFERKVDLVTPAALKPVLRERIQEDLVYAQGL